MRTHLVGISILVVALLVVPGALFAQGTDLQPGDNLYGMPLRSGGSEGPPLWAFCSPAFLNPGTTTTQCTVPPLPEVAIGHGWFAADEALRDASWEAMAWELYLDGQQVNLDAFGTYDADLPQTGLPGHEPDKEVITKLRSWDVVLGNPAAGQHTLRSVLVVSQPVDDGFHVTEAGTYELVVSFVVEAPPPSTLAETGGSMSAGRLWPAAAGLLVLALGVCLQQVFRRAADAS